MRHNFGTMHCGSHFVLCILWHHCHQRRYSFKAAGFSTCAQCGSYLIPPLCTISNLWNVHAGFKLCGLSKKFGGHVVSLSLWRDKWFWSRTHTKFTASLPYWLVRVHFLLRVLCLSVMCKHHSLEAPASMCVCVYFFSVCANVPLMPSQKIALTGMLRLIRTALHWSGRRMSQATASKSLIGKQWPRLSPVLFHLSAMCDLWVNKDNM